MFMFITAKETLYPLYGSDRKREMIDWKVKFDTLKDGTQRYYLQGQVIKEADGTVPPFRISTTSPIVSCTSDGLVKTISGSEYKLLPQREDDASVFAFLNMCNAAVPEFFMRSN